MTELPLVTRYLTGLNLALMDMAPAERAEVVAEIKQHISDATAAGKPIDDACGVQRLPNGNTVITSHHAKPEGVKLTEVDRDKKIVWQHRDATKPGIHHFQILDTNGKGLEGRPLR